MLPTLLSWTSSAVVHDIIIITVTGISLAFGDTSGGFRKMVQVVFGLSIAFAASSSSRSSPSVAEH